MSGNWIRLTPGEVPYVNDPWDKYDVDLDMRIVRKERGWQVVFDSDKVLIASTKQVAHVSDSPTTYIFWKD